APAGPSPAPAPGAPAGGGPSTYRLPQATGRRRAAPAPRTSRSAPRTGTTRRISTGEAIRRRPRVASAVAGTVAFLAAVYLGTILFAPDTGAADTPDPGSTPTAGLESPAATDPAVAPAGDGDDEDD
ncbi:serine/threonine protein kinase, partial [Streptomyces sp. NPDC060030]